MLTLKIEINDNCIGTINVVRGLHHEKIKGAYYYTYTAIIDNNTAHGGEEPGYKVSQGYVIHKVKNGAAPLVSKVMRAIVKQQKEARNDAS